MFFIHGFYTFFSQYLIPYVNFIPRAITECKAITAPNIDIVVPQRDREKGKRKRESGVCVRREEER